MGEAKRRKKSDPNFGKNPRYHSAKKLDLELFEKYMDLPLEEYSEPENAQLVEEGIEQLLIMAEKAGIEMPSLPTDFAERQRTLHLLKQLMANSRLELPDGTIVE